MCDLATPAAGDKIPLPLTGPSQSARNSQLSGTKLGLLAYQNSDTHLPRGQLMSFPKLRTFLFTRSSVSVQLLCALVLVAVPGLAQSSTFRADVNLVNVTFGVRSPDGKLISDLKEDEVEVLEDGVPQAIRFFSRTSDFGLDKPARLQPEPFRSRPSRCGRWNCPRRRWRGRALADPGRCCEICYQQSSRGVLLAPFRVPPFAV
jgi:hypothetical protein